MLSLFGRNGDATKTPLIEVDEDSQWLEWALPLIKALDDGKDISLPDLECSADVQLASMQRYIKYAEAQDASSKAVMEKPLLPPVLALTILLTKHADYEITSRDEVANRVAMWNPDIFQQVGMESALNAYANLMKVSYNELCRDHESGTY